MQNLILTLKHLFQDSAVAPNSRVRVQGIVSQVKSAMDAAVCSLYISDEEGVLTLVATDGLNPDSVGKITLHPGEGLVGWIAESHHPLNVEDASENPHFLYFPDSGEEIYKAFLGAPVVHSGKLAGVLVVEKKERRKFTEEEESFLVTVAAHLGATNPDEFQPEPDHPRDVEPVKSASLRFKGIAGGPGVGIGRVLFLSGTVDLMTSPDVEATDIPAEIQHFREAVKATLVELAESQRKVADSVSNDVAEIFSIYQMLLEGADFTGEVERVIHTGKSAISALRSAVVHFTTRFEEMEDEYLRARGEDIRNLGSRVYARLRNVESPKIAKGDKVVLAGSLVSISDIAEYPIEQLAGIVSKEGSALSHTAVLAKALGVPAVMGVGHVGDIPDGALMIVDGYQGQIFINPAKSVIAEFRRLIAIESSLAKELAKLKELPAESTDGFRIHLHANTGLLADITPGLTHGAEGIGLYRTEIPYIVHGSFPAEEEQVEVYRSVLDAYAGMPVYMRTLDVGGDKPLPYFPFEEENPALGWRGVRFTLDNSVIFMTQIRAMLRAAGEHHQLHIILPMIASVTEVDSCLSLLETALEQLKEEGIPVSRPRMGIMAEVPASIAILPFLKGKIDFVSVGSNDLTQYLLAVDRNNTRVSALFDHVHPATLQAVEEITIRSRALGIPVSVCGEMAADPCSALLLLGLGIDSLSMSAFSIPRIKWLIRTVSRKEAEEQLAFVKQCSGPAAVRVLLKEFLVSKGLGRLFEPFDK
ncbi:MAG: phosphoenolpyruvate--protein phosphotransferase [Verrucomicrobiales bacterium]|nr:phosphoenolpyruvate--protein phosphotransferase [Verrucomicrobiales bacterium]